MKKLTRSRTDHQVGGVLGGLGEYFEVDATLIRLGYLLLMIATGIIPGLIVYAIAMLVIPETPVIAVPEEVHDTETV